MNTKQATDLIGKPGLFRVHGPDEHEIVECNINRLSPSGSYALLTGGRDWVETDKLTLLEELPARNAKAAKAPAVPIVLVKAPGGAATTEQTADSGKQKAETETGTETK